MKVEKRTPEVVTPPEEYVITLTEEEARSLERVLSRAVDVGPELSAEDKDFADSLYWSI